MNVNLDTEVLIKLTGKGVLAYVAVSMKMHGTYSTAFLASLVGCRTDQVREGLEELATVIPSMVVKGSNGSKGKWILNPPEGFEGVQNLDNEVNGDRRQEFIEDLQLIWNWANPKTPFTMGRHDGNVINIFLRQHRDWDRATWRQALRHKFLSEGPRAEAPYRWMSRLAEYLEAPLDRYNKPMAHGVGGKLGQALDTEAGNRAAREAFLSADRP